ncbi:CMRF35-like molecule 1 [Kryptolebias marmoratus]|uniref:CMRF35-like molecule 1 n=1 Tax=Kryptolebias marmoratus TaxID=37003 RepID=UPI0018ACD0CF|nr:CMRF35-like molecule 1 [Kryptolebias marmoratus]
MTTSIVLHLIFTGLVGIHCGIQTVTEVPVEAGGSVSIPCLYEQKYKNNVKYLCKGKKWRPCKNVIETKQTIVSEKFFISDDTKQSVFTVTIHELTDEEDYFWCAVEKTWWDVKQQFKLLVTSASSSLYVKQQEITAFERGSVTIICHYNDPKVTKWCRLGSTCVSDEFGSIDGTTVKINSSLAGIFNVTMSDLRTENSGWYWCDSGELQMPVHVTVLDFITTTTVLTTTTTQSLSPYTTSYTGSTESDTVQLINSTRNETEGVNLQDEHKSSTKVTILVSTLLLQLLIVLAAIFGWRMMKHKKSKSNESGISLDPQTPDSDIFYTTVVHNQHVPIQTKQDQLYTGSAIYDNIKPLDNVDQMTAAPEGSVIYSTLK